MCHHFWDGVYGSYKHAISLELEEEQMDKNIVDILLEMIPKIIGGVIIIIIAGILFMTIITS